jgi:hypothetical protein
MSNQHSDFTESGVLKTCDAFKLEPQTSCLFDDAYGSFMKVGPVKMPTFETPNDVIGPVKMPTFEPSKDVIGPVKMPTFDKPDDADCVKLPPLDDLQHTKDLSPDTKQSSPDAKQLSPFDCMKAELKRLDEQDLSNEEREGKEFLIAAKYSAPIFPGQPLPKCQDN